MRDFTLNRYKTLLETLLEKGYNFIPFRDYQADKFSVLNVQSSMDEKLEVRGQKSDVKSDTSTSLSMTKQVGRTPSAAPIRLCILRHDVDKLPENSLVTAKIENEFGIKGTYYFRSVPESFDASIIKQIAMLGHEIGYHYEEIDFAWRQINGQWSMFNGQYKKNKNTAIKQSGNDTSTPLSMTIDLSYEMLKKNLDKLRNIVPVNTICMHGSPLSPWDNKEIWSKYSYKELGIIGEPYFDIDWNVFGYLTDTGRRWDGYEVSVRDKVHNIKNSMFNVQLKSTSDIIENADSLPDRLMINVHPQRWNDKLVPWFNQLIFQNIKNVIKRFIVEE